MTTAQRRVREKEKRRGDILAAARKVFRALGYEAATMPAIARQAELAPGTIYLYFPAKQALYAELLNEGYDILLARLEKSARPGAAPRRQAEALADVFLRFARDYPDYFDIIFFVIQSGGRGMHEALGRGDLLDRLNARQDACRRIVAEALERAGGKPPLARVEAIWSMLAGVVLYFRRDPPDHFAAVSREARQIILKGLFDS